MNDYREHEPRDAAMPAEERPPAAPAAPFSAVTDRAAERLKHSGIGIASTVLGIIAVILSLIAFSMVITGAADIAEEFTGGTSTITDEQAMELVSRYPGLIGGVILFLASGFLFFIGVILGIIGLFSQNRKKLFPILGTILNAFPIGIMLILMIGITMIG